MEQPKKIFTRMYLSNWGGISHKVLEFNEYINLFSGMSGSGKSTVMDAIQMLLYGSMSSNFLNKAADDSKNKRSVFSYLRGVPIVPIRIFGRSLFWNWRIPDLKQTPVSERGLK